MLTIWKVDNTKVLLIKFVDCDMGKVTVNGVIILITTDSGKMGRDMAKAP